MEWMGGFPSDSTARAGRTRLGRACCPACGHRSQSARAVSGWSGWTPARYRVVDAVRTVRRDVSTEDPAGFRPEGERGQYAYVLVEEYTTPALRVAQAFLGGASLREALAVFRQEMARLYPDRELSRRAVRRLARKWRWNYPRWWDLRSIDHPRWARPLFRYLAADQAYEGWHDSGGEPPRPATATAQSRS